MISLKKHQSNRLVNIALCGIFFAFLFIATEHNKPLKKRFIISTAASHN